MTDIERTRLRQDPQYQRVKELLRYPTAHLPIAAEVALCTWMLKIEGTLK